MDHSHHDMPGMSPTSTAPMATGTSTAKSGTSGMHMMMSMGTFHWSSSGDGIWLDSWVPRSEGAYIGACFGLFFCSLLSRSIPALEAYFVAWARLRNDRQLKTHSTIKHIHEITKTDIEESPNLTDNFSASSRSINPTAYPNSLCLPVVPSFSFKTDTIRSFITTLNSFVGYLLMMVVMTGNGGFFLVIVLGVFFGELAFGRFRSLGGLLEDHSH
ncbi:Ctr copper transporter family-domain-containing protein [Cokeromyces recurvatus]|uniref:Ctr copper transporter family-domain-containing protein n=1 Tax=Cokeromyces recurvatus TaxID=90255 RepID=UPI00221FDC7E|nr:Ctr copper transporter family-domain-containing protein [Cokeromyces recurvatus]KAI7905130.1 Ctr copper transporter family-domain-containing protein [Cokeromyces recurvatus]